MRDLLNADQVRNIGNAHNMPKGVYLVELRSEGESLKTVKLILQ